MSKPKARKFPTKAKEQIVEKYLVLFDFNEFRYLSNFYQNTLKQNQYIRQS